MKKTILLLGVLCLLLTGCADEYRVTTVVYIPVSPTEAPEQSEEMLPQETQRPAETESIPEETTPVSFSLAAYMGRSTRLSHRDKTETKFV